MNLFHKWASQGARVVLGLVFVVFGLNYFLPFLPAQPAPPEAALPFLGGLEASGYVFPMVKTIEVVAGIALLGNRFVPLALTLLAPIIVNIAAFHLLLAPAYPMAITLVALSVYLAWIHRAAFAPLLRVQPERGTAEASLQEGISMPANARQ